MNSAVFVRGSALKVGDVMRVWWRTEGDRISDLRPYTHYHTAARDGVRHALFDHYHIGMAIEPHGLYPVFNRPIATEAQRFAKMKGRIEP